MIEINKKGLIPFLDVVVCPKCQGKRGIDIGDSNCPDCNEVIVWVDKKEN